MEIRQTAAYVRSIGRIDTKPVPGNAALGAALYRAKGNCTACHSLHGEGGVAGPDLTDIGERRSPEYLRNALINPEADLPEGYLLVTASPKSGAPVTGIRVNEDSFSIQLRDAAGRSHSFWKSDLASIEKKRGKSGMPSYKSRFTDPELTDLIAYLATLKPAPTPDRTLPTSAINVPFERIRDASTKEPGNWLTYSRDYTGQRHSPLDQINAGNVAKLHIAWMHQVNESDAFEVSPIVVDGTMFITEPGNAVSALDARTGRTLWHYERPAPSGLRLCCGKVNRGVAILGDTVYYGSVDAHLVALDARTGTLRWDVVMADYKKGYSSTGAPLAVHDKIIIGMAGGEFGVRGFIDAYDAKTGKRA